MRKKFHGIIIILLLISLVGCGMTTNEIITKHIEYEPTINVADMEDALVTATSIGEKAVVGVVIDSGTLISNISFGSGVIVKRLEKSSGGQLSGYKYYLFTNRHVIEASSSKIAGKIKIYLGQYNEQLDAQVEGYSKYLDLALLSFETTRLLGVATIGDSAAIEKGRYVIAIGNPYNLYDYYNTVTIGNISHNLRIYTDSVFGGGTTNNFYLQHDAAINKGNSGGGLFNINGALVGINTWKISAEGYEGLGFAIPIHLAVELFKDQLK